MNGMASTGEPEKSFIRRAAGGDWVWPTSESFSRQHRRVLRRRPGYSFPVNPMAGRDRAEMVEVALARASAVSFIPIEEIDPYARP